MSAACNCCEEPPCPTPALEFLSISGVSGPCGYLAGAGDAVGSSLIGYQSTTGLPDPEFRRRYSRIVVTAVSSRTGSGEGGYGFDHYTDYVSSTKVLTAARTVDGEDCITEDLTGTYEFTIGYSGTYDDPGEGDVLLSSAGEGSYTVVDGDFVGSATETYTYALSGEVVYSLGRLINGPTCDEGEVGCPEVAWSGATWTATYSDGSITVQYLDPTALIFPEWALWETPDEELEDGQGRLETAVRTEDEVLTKVRFRIKHSPSGTCYLRAWIAQTFTPDPDPEAPPGTPDPEPVITVVQSVWEGSGNPCIEFPLLGVGHEDNIVRHEPVTYDFTGVTGAGTTTFEVIKWACIPDYVPDLDDITKPNGYPAPAAT